TNKIFSISFDNASNNTAAIPDLIIRCRPPLNGEFFYIRCACHILNLVVQDALRAVGSSVHKIKSAILCIKNSYQQKRMYVEAYQHSDVKSKLIKDSNTR
ncbi:hypothetical protein L8N14_017270, partial [Serratia marcescens]|nr:hypothetical protein [Serratia marcescens]